MLNLFKDFCEKIGVSQSGVLFGFLTMIIGIFISSLIVIIFVLNLPTDYLVSSPSNIRTTDHTLSYWIKIILKNVLGLFLIVAGIVMLVVPGQGLLTILIGMILLDFPGRKKFERKVISHPKIFKALNQLRARYNKVPLKPK